MNRILIGSLLALVLAGKGDAQAPAGKPGAPIAEHAARVPISAGAVLRTRPTPSAPVVTIVEDDTVGELVEERSGWRRVRIDAITGWIAPEGADRALAASPPETNGKRLGQALARLGESPARADALGLALYAPHDDATRLERWAVVARRTIESWPGRLGVEPVSMTGAAVVFVPEEAVGAAGPGAADDATPGNAGGGVALLHLGERSDDEVEALLVHELSHLLSERAFPKGLPIWLEEGIAEWLAREPLASDGNSLPGMLRGEVTVERERGGRRIDYTGPLADLARLARDAQAGTLPALDLWTAIPAAEFSKSADRDAHYALAGSFVRFLFEADETRAGVVRGTLAEAAGSGADVDSELDRRLGDVGELDRAFRAWLGDELERQTVPAEM